MGNVFKLFRNWLSLTDERAKEITGVVHEQPISTRQPVYSWYKVCGLFKLERLNNKFRDRLRSIIFYICTGTRTPTLN